MVTHIPSQQAAPFSASQALEQAIACHQAGQLMEAEMLYLAILQTEPNHPEANHNMGVLAVQSKQPAAGLPYFMAALDVDPACKQYWLSYIDALFQAGQLDDARQMLAFARQQGLEGDDVDALAVRFESGVPEKNRTEIPHAIEEYLPGSSPASYGQKSPSHHEIDALVALFADGRLDEAAAIALTMTERYPSHEFGWKALGAVYKQMGRDADALAPMQKAAALSPGDVEAHYNLGATLQSLGRLLDAEASYLQALRINKNYADAHCNLGVILQSLGRLEEAEISFRRALQLMPDNAEMHGNLGFTLHELGKLDGAEASFRQTLRINPNNAAAYNNLGKILKELGRTSEAETCYRQALRIEPDNFEAYYNLGNTLKELGLQEEVEACYRKALQIKPDFAEAHYNLGATLQDMGRLIDAEASYRGALQSKPDYAEAHYNLGIVLRDMGRLIDAVASYRRAIQIKPDNAGAHNNLGVALKELGRLDEAEDSYRRALLINPDFADAHTNLGGVLKEMSRNGEAAACFHRALKINPDFAEAHNNLGITLQDQNQFDEAETSYRSALQIKPDYAEAYNNLGTLLRELGRISEAEASFLQALQIKPDYARAYSNLLFLHGYHATLDPHAYCSLAGDWERACVSTHVRQQAQSRTFQRPSLSGRRLKVGYVSGDYRQHTVSYFIEQIFANHDRKRIELFAYSNHWIHDSITEGLQAQVDHWVSVVGMSDMAVLNQINSDGIDVLIDLSGHTAANRMGVFAHRAAPVQIHYLGFMASTGLAEMDYWIGDEILTSTETNNHFTEQIWRLPRVWVSYKGSADMPQTDWHPDQAGNICLGCFNNLCKLTPATLALWAKVLHALPEGKILLKTKELANEGNRQRIWDAMSGHGILPGRIELMDRSVTPDWRTHMTYYDRLDIALDPVGAVGGGTTSCDALWMGAPVITLEGDRMASRMTATMLDAIGHPEWIAHTEAEYIDKVVTLARDVEQRKVLRSRQRERMALSPLCDAHGLARSLENAYFEMFERWLNKKVEQSSQ